MASTLHGVPAAGGVAVGTCLLYDPAPPDVPQYHIAADKVAAERERLSKAIETSIEEVTQLRDGVLARVGKEEAAIFDAHLLILEDDALLDGANTRIEEELVNAEWALWSAAEESHRCC